MPLMRHLREAAFEPTAIEAMTAAFEAVCKSLQLLNRDDPIAHVVARKIIEIARSGEHDPQRIHDLALAEFMAQGSSED
jgi:hypothetical protein